MTKIGFTAFDIKESPADELPSHDTTVSNEATADKPKPTRRKSEKTEDNDADDSDD